MDRHWLVTVTTLVVLALGCNRCDREQKASTGSSRKEGSPTPRASLGGKLTYQGRNSKGFEEYLWLKDSSVVVKIPAGSFIMGSKDGENDELPEHKVTLEEFYIDKYEVTRRQYKEFCNATGRDDYGLDGRPNVPVVWVTWADARAYAAWAGKRLPSEAEWEKAARGVDGRKYPWGNSDPNGGTCSFADPNSREKLAYRKAGDGYPPGAPVGSYPKDASPYGTMDMAGNVSEWCADWYNDVYYGTSPKDNPRGPALGDCRVFRGGSYLTDAWFLRCARRDYRSLGGDGKERSDICPQYHECDLGFRCAR